jgi:hypothetical protein
MPPGVYDHSTRRVNVSDAHFRIMQELRAKGVTVFNIGMFFGMNNGTAGRVFRNRGVTFMRGNPGNGRGREWASTRRATRRPTLRELEWAAGFLEGEASFSGGRIHVSQVNPEPLKRLLDIFGGNINEPRQRAVGCRPIGEWRVSGARARGVLLTIFELMSQRRKAQIRKALLATPERSAA